jgi:protease-4
VAFTILFGSGGCITLNLGGSQSRKMEETVVYGTKGPKVLLLEIDGEIRSSDAAGILGFVLSEGTVGRVSDQLKRARASGDIEAILLRINSPGGSAAASDAVYQQILKFKQETGIPVIAHFMSMAASGGYFVAMAADEIAASRSGVTGSIGVILLSVNLSGLMEKLGVENQTLTSGPFKDAGSMIRPMSNDERAQLQSVVDDLYAQFVEVVDAGRPDLTTEQVRAVADGRIYSAKQALEVGLIDRIATLEETVEYMKEKVAADEIRVVAYHRGRESPSNIYSSAIDPPEQMQLGNEALERLWPRPGFHYLWLPGVR